ncbi:MAG: crossover junction endodeoxyribonuclease RuvC [Tepidisphaeraceae bacterium]
MRYLGIDPGLQITGYGVLDVTGVKPLLVDAGVIRLTAKQPIPKRLVELEAELVSLIDEAKPEAIAVEQLYAHYKHPRTAILMGHARGVILLAAARKNIRLIEISANRIKKNLTGFGHASKLQMQRGVQDLFRLKTLPQPPDVADAIAIALCAARGD